MGRNLDDIIINAPINKYVHSFKASDTVNAYLTVSYNWSTTVVGAPQTYQAYFSMPCKASQGTTPTAIHNLMTSLSNTYGTCISGWVQEISAKTYYPIVGINDINYNKVQYIKDGKITTLQVLTTEDYYDWSWTIKEDYVKTTLITFD